MDTSAPLFEDTSSGRPMPPIVVIGSEGGRSRPGPSTPDLPKGEGERRERKKDKERKRLRSAWFSFIGRIVAQVVGSLATVALGLILADHIRESADASRGVARASVPATIANPASIAVLPLITFSANKGREYISDSLTEALITDLARINSLEVTSRTSAMQYKGQTKLVPEIGRELGVAYVLEGSVVEADGRTRVTAQLIDARTDLHVWTDTYDREGGDVLSWQDDVSRRIARAVNSALSSKRSAGVPAGPSSSAATTP